MTAGEMEKAAEELEKLDMPELDRKTEKAIKEKLEKIAAESPNGAKKNLKNALQSSPKACAMAIAPSSKKAVKDLLASARNKETAKSFRICFANNANAWANANPNVKASAQAMAKAKAVRIGGWEPAGTKLVTRQPN